MHVGLHVRFLLYVYDWITSEWILVKFPIVKFREYIFIDSQVAIYGEGAAVKWLGWYLQTFIKNPT
jgi:hypothetical protein